MSLHNSSVSDIGAALSLSDDAVKEMLQKAEDRLLESMRTRTDPAPARLNIVQKGSTLDQRFEQLKSDLEKFISDQLKVMRDQVDLSIANRIDYHMGGYVEPALKHMEENIADLLLQWDDFQEDER